VLVIDGEGCCVYRPGVVGIEGSVAQQDMDEECNTGEASYPLVCEGAHASERACR